jgi:hypothetical protein
MEHIPEAALFSEGLETVHVLASMLSELNGPFVSSEMFQGLQKELDLHGEQFAGEDIDEAEEDSSVDEMEEFMKHFQPDTKVYSWRGQARSTQYGRLAKESERAEYAKNECEDIRIAMAGAAAFAHGDQDGEQNLTTTDLSKRRMAATV